MKPAFVAVLLSALLAPTALSAKTIELILDASGSMNAQLPSGDSRLAAAKKAVSQLVAGLPKDTELAFRAYGHQSPREKHDCNDTQLLVNFGAAGANGAQVDASSRGLTARGYTPITRVLELAAKDFIAGNKKGEKAIVLVSDGKETCDGDPCATAAALAAADVELSIHAIGFEVDIAARKQLQCIAKVARGSYADAGDAAQLAAALRQAVVAKMETVAPMGKEPGNLQVKGADLAGHQVKDAAGKVAGEISSTVDTIKLPPGLYQVSFGNAWWKSVSVESKKLTVLEPAILEVENAGINGHPVMDSETGAKIAEVSSIKKAVTLLPGVYDVGFSKLVWPLVKIDGGKKTLLRPGRLKVEGASFNGHKVKTAAGVDAGEVSNMAATLPLPPGDYTVDIGGKAVPFKIAPGQTVSVPAK
jgi:Mg-chelatase subunit ChlD